MQDSSVAHRNSHLLQRTAHLLSGLPPLAEADNRVTETRSSSPTRKPGAASTIYLQLLHVADSDGALRDALCPIPGAPLSYASAATVFTERIATAAKMLGYKNAAAGLRRKIAHKPRSYRGTNYEQSKQRK